MHRLFVSEGIVLSKRGVGEAHVIASILTREFGLLRAKATSTRAEKSKLRFGLEPLTRARFSFVEGRHEWKLVGAEALSVSAFSPHAGHRAAMGRVSKLLLRLVNGEEPHARLYEHVESGISSLAFAEGGDELRSVECVLVLRVLSTLGYLPEDAVLSPFLESPAFSKELSLQAAAARAHLIRTINESLSQTGL